MVRCVECGEVQWNLLFARGSGKCRLCGAELKIERRRPGRRFARLKKERRDTRT
jgi:hypothetical protein